MIEKLKHNMGFAAVYSIAQLNREKASTSVND